MNHQSLWNLKYSQAPRLMTETCFVGTGVVYCNSFFVNITFISFLVGNLIGSLRVVYAVQPHLFRNVWLVYSMLWGGCCVSLNAFLHRFSTLSPTLAAAPWARYVRALPGRTHRFRAYSGCSVVISNAECISAPFYV